MANETNAYLVTKWSVNVTNSMTSVNSLGTWTCASNIQIDHTEQIQICSTFAKYDIIISVDSFIGIRFPISYALWIIWRNKGKLNLKCKIMMTSSNANIFGVSGQLCGEFTGHFPTQRPVVPSFDVFFDLRPNKRLSKQSWCWWIETP